jgi:hypothetical protein
MARGLGTVAQNWVERTERRRREEATAGADLT